MAVELQKKSLSFIISKETLDDLYFKKLTTDIPKMNATRGIECSSTFSSHCLNGAVRDARRAGRRFRPAHVITCGPHTGLSSMFLQRKGSQSRTDHMIKPIIS